MSYVLGCTFWCNFFCFERRGNIVDEKITYIDITKEWEIQKNDEEGYCVNQYYFIDNGNNCYIVDDKNIILDHTSSEIIIATWFAKKKGINVGMLPRVLKPKGIKTADFIEISSKKAWEIKEPFGDTIPTTIENQFKNQRRKATNFIIDIHNCGIGKRKFVIEILKILANTRYSWIETVVIVKDLNVIKVYKKGCGTDQGVHVQP